MLQSMTGFGRSLISVDGRSVQVEIKSVNSRFCEIQVRMPRSLLEFEPQLRQTIAAQIGRGKLDVFVTCEDCRAEAKTVKVDYPLVQTYHEVLEDLGQRLDRPYQTRIADLLRQPQLITIEESEIAGSDWQELILQAAEEATAKLVQARQVEGERLKEALEAHLQTLEAYLNQLLTQAPDLISLYQQRLRQRMQDLLGQTEIDETRILQEVAVWSDKTDVTEELTRLGSHLPLFKETLTEEGSVGKKLDFVVQEINREINTTGSKSNHADLTRIVVEMKCEAEKLREQIQNIE